PPTVTHPLSLRAALPISAGIIEVSLDPGWLRMPLAGFLAGLSLVALGLLWVYPVQTSLLSQLAAGRPRRSHWLPLACVLIAYTLDRKSTRLNSSHVKISY